MGGDCLTKHNLLATPESTNNFIILAQLLHTTYHIPEPYKKGLTKVIPKKPIEDTKLAQDLRPITLISIIYKTYERLLFSELNSQYDIQNKLHPNQFGFRKWQGTTFHIAILSLCSEKASENNEPLYTACLDIKKA